MADPSRWTIVAEFRGATSLIQVRADGVDAAVSAWTDQLADDRPFGRASAYLANAIRKRTPEYPPVAVTGLRHVWVVDALCGGDLMLANFIGC